MAIVEVTEIWNGRRASRDVANVREYDRVFRIRTDNMRDGPFQVGANGITGLPGLFAPYVDNYGNVDAGAILQKFEPHQGEDPFEWEIACMYSSAIDRYAGSRERGASGRSGKAEQAQKGSNDDNPLNRPPVIQMTPNRYQKELRVVQVIDQNNNLVQTALRNSAGDPYDPPLVGDRTRQSYTYDRNEASYNITQVKLLQDVLNSDMFWQENPYTWKLNVSASSAYENGLFYWKKTYHLEFKADTWLEQVEDKGTRQLVMQNQVTKVVDITDPMTAARVSSPVLLDGNGHPLAQNAQPVFLPQAPFVGYLLYGTIVFASLALMQPN